MKKTTLLFSFVAVFICGSCALNNSSEIDEKEFAKKAFETIKSNDYDAFHKMVITSEEFINLLPSTTWSEEKKNNIKTKLTQQFLDEAAKGAFDEMQKNAKEYVIDFSKAKIDSVITKTLVKEGLNELKFKLYFTNNAESYYLRGDKCLMTSNGWKMADGATLYKVQK